MIANHIIVGINQLDVNNEIRFLVAGARVDGKVLMRLNFSSEAVEKQKQYAVRVLRSLKKDGIIEFFVLSENLNADSTEAVYLMNKYGEYIDESVDCVYVKL